MGVAEDAPSVGQTTTNQIPEGRRRASHCHGPHDQEAGKRKVGDRGPEGEVSDPATTRFLRASQECATRVTA